jgi:hypothetical protein
MLFVVKENLIPNNNNNDDDDKNLIKLKLGYVCTIYRSFLLYNTTK